MANLIRYIVQDDPEQSNKETQPAEKTSASASVLNQPHTSAAFAADADQEIRERMFEIIKGHEEEKDFPYKDSKGKITIGIGSNIDDLVKFNSIDWQDEQGRRIRPSEAAKYRNVLHSIEGNNYVADYYRDKTPLRISNKEMRQLFNVHFNNDLKEIRETFPNFNRFPKELQNVLLDIKYNTGNVKQEKWPRLHKAIAMRNLKKILDNVHRQGVGLRRNNWAENEIRKIKSLDY